MSAPTKKTNDVPKVELDAPLKIESAVEGEQTPYIEKNGKYLFFSGIFFTLVVFTITGFIYFASKNKLAIPGGNKTETDQKVTTATSEAKLNWSVEVLNGSKVNGVASILASKLSSLGFRVVKVGNADSKKYTGVNVYLEKNLLNNSDEFLLLLKQAVPNATVSGLLESSTASARIIIGK